MVVDDSAVIRAKICDCVAQTPGLEVAGTASNGRRALETFESLRPDVVTLDIQMPDMDGLSTLDALLAIRPVPVIMVSALTQAGATVTLDALDRGAIDYVCKPESRADLDSVFGDELPRKIRAAVGADVCRILRIRQDRKVRRAEKAAQKRVVSMPEEDGAVESADSADKCVALGISTGGPPALASLFETLRPPMPPIVVVQHMPAQFTKPLSWRLNNLSQLTIKEAASDDTLQANHVYIAPGGRHLSLRRLGDRVRVVLRDDEPVSGHRPSVDVMMKSAAACFGSSCLGVIMTGMGHDGVEGCATIRAAGGYVLGQDEATSDVYGMNKVAFTSGHVDRQFSLSEAAKAIVRQLRAMGSRTAATAR
jgi:two-component system chemotaxis response regulator CheB